MTTRNTACQSTSTPHNCRTPRPSNDTNTLGACQTRSLGVSLEALAGETTHTHYNRSASPQCFKGSLARLDPLAPSTLVAVQALWPTFPQHAPRRRGGTPGHCIRAKIQWAPRSDEARRNRERGSRRRPMHARLNSRCKERPICWVRTPPWVRNDTPQYHHSPHATLLPPPTGK